MWVLLIVVVASVTLAARAGLFGWRRSIDDTVGAAGDTSLLFGACARALIQVLLSLLGLWGLAVTYGNLAR